MKKFAYLAVAFVLGAFTSCTDKEEIEIIQHRDLSLKINTSKTYETFGITNFENLLGNNDSYHVGVTSLVYNVNGKLCDSLFSSTRTFQSVSQTLKGLQEGKYTVITFETIVDKNDNYKSTIWELARTDSLDSVRVVYKKGRSNAYWYENFGYCSTSISVGEDNTVEITPELVGCWISLSYENFDKSSYNYFSLAAKNPADGFYLSPSHSNDRFYISDYSKSNTYGRLAYEYNSDKLPSSDESTFYVFETGRKTCMFGGAKNMWVNGNTNYDDWTNDFYFNFESGKWYTAYCYYKGRPDVFASYLGLSSEFNSWYKNLDKTMNPLYAEPCINWGTTVSYVKNFMRNYSVLQDVTEFESVYYLSYYGNYSEYEIDYSFTRKDSGLFRADINILKDVASTESILEQIDLTKYEFIEYNEYEDNPMNNHYLYADSKTYIGVFPNGVTYDVDGNEYKYTQVSYLDRTIEDGEESRASSRSSVKSSTPKILLNNKLRRCK